MMKYMTDNDRLSHSKRVKYMDVLENGPMKRPISKIPKQTCMTSNSLILLVFSWCKSTYIGEHSSILVHTTM